jgi:hypothetical protein
MLNVDQHIYMFVIMDHRKCHNIQTYSFFQILPLQLNNSWKSENNLKISKGQSDSVYRRRTDNIMAKKVQKDKQRSTKHTHKTKDWVTRSPLKTWVNSGAPEGWAISAPLVTSVVLIWLQTRW